MSREKKFRGKRRDNEEWVYGYYIHTDFADYIMPAKYAVNWKVFIQVIPETVGEFTGHHDKNDVEIYESDKLQVGKCPLQVTVFWDEQIAAWLITNPHIKRGGLPLLSNYANEFHNIVEVIGNIH